MKAEVSLNDSTLKEPAKWFLDGFHRFLRGYLKRHFHCFAVDRERRPDSNFADGRPIILFANHPSWWDPLTAQFLNRTLFEGYSFYAPIDAEALEQYRVFERLGFFGVRLSSKTGAAQFLLRSREVLRRDRSALWITPEGRFSDVRDQEATLMPGLAHLCHREDNAVVAAIALEYAFWDERLPICFTSLSPPTLLSDHPDWTKAQWSTYLSEQLRETQSRLSEMVIARSSEPFDNLLAGKKGTGWFYDSFRRIKSLATRQPYRATHGDQF